MVKRALQVGCVVAVAIFLGGLSAQAGVFTEQPKKLIEERAYCGVFGTAVGIGNGGQFTGKLIMTTVDTSISGSADLIPKIKSYYGGGGLAGYRKNEYAIEISYWRSEHVAQWMAPLVTYEDRATYHAVNIDLKKYFFPRIPVQPYCMMGFSLPWLVVKNSSTPFPGLIPVQVGDTSWTGLGYNLGAGLEFYATKRVSVYGAAIQRWTGFNHAKGLYRIDENVMNGTNQDFNLKGDNLNFTAGLTIDVL